MNIEADSIVRDGGYVEAWKRVPPDKILEKGAVYETVGVFSEEAFDFIYISESEK